MRLGENIIYGSNIFLKESEKATYSIKQLEGMLAGLPQLLELDTLQGAKRVLKRFKVCNGQLFENRELDFIWYPCKEVTLAVIKEATPKAVATPPQKPKKIKKLTTSPKKPIKKAKKQKRK